MDKNELQARLLSIQEVKTIYDSYMQQDFPRNELRPFSMIKKLMNEHIYYTYGIFKESKLCAYAFFLEDRKSGILLFDYFAVCSQHRGQGYGTKALHLILETCKEKNGVLLEVEDPSFAENEEERGVRERRIQFYEKCGIHRSDVQMLLFGVNYCIMYQSFTSDDMEDHIVETIQEIYKKLVPKLLYKKILRIL